MKTKTLQAMNAALSALNANDTRPAKIRAEYLDLFRTRADVQEFSRLGTEIDDDDPAGTLAEECSWVDEAWDAVQEYIEARDSE